eukprot:g7377.t1
MSPRRMPTGHFNDDDGDNVSVFAVDEIDQSLHELLDKRNRALLEVRKATAHLESCNLALHCSAKRYNKRNACTLNLNPDVKKVEESFASTIPQWRDVWRTSIADIGKYGVGCQLYFEFLKWLVLIFGGMAVFSTPLMYTCMHGTMVSSPFGALAKTTIGNLGELPPDLNTAMSKKEQIQMLRNRRLVLGDREFDMHRFTTFFGLLDGFCILCFFLWAFWYRKKQLIATVETHDVANTTPNDYSVHISNLPCSIWKNGVRLNLDEYQDLLQSHIDGVLRANVARNVAATTAYYYDGGHTMSSLLEESSMLPDLNYNDPNKDENRHSDGFSDDEEDERFCCMFFRGFRRSLRRLVPQQDDEHSRHMSQRVANESLDLDKENNWAPVPELQLGEFVLCCRDHGSLNQLNRRIRLGKKRRRLEYQIEERKTTLREQRDLMLLEDQGVNYLEDPRRSDDDDLLRDAPLRGVKLNFDAVGGAVDRDLQHDPLLRALQQQLRQNQRQIKRAAHLLKKRVASRKENEVVRAFVIFDHCLDKEIFLWAYKNKHQSDEKEFLGKLAGKSEFLRSLFGLDLRESPLAFEGKLLKVQPAPEPSNLLWENVDGLPDNFFKAFPRRYGASMVSGVLLFLSFVLVFFCEVLPEVGWTDVGGFTLNEAQLVQKLPLRAARKVEVLSTTPPLDFPTSREQGAGALQTEGGRRSSYDEEEGRGAGGASASFGASDVPDLPRFPASARVPEYEVEMELEFPLQLFLPERDGVLGVHGGDEWRDSGAFAHRYRFQDGVLDRAAVVTDAEAHFLQNYLGQEKYAEAGKAVFPWLFSANAKKPDYLLQNDQRDFSAANDIVSPASGGSSTAETSGEQQSVACSSLNLYLEHVFARTKFYQVPEQPLPETEQEALARPLMHASESAIQLELREDSDSTSKKEPVYFSANVTQLVRDFLEEAPVEHQLRFLEIGGEGGGLSFPRISRRVRVRFWKPSEWPFSLYLLRSDANVTNLSVCSADESCAAVTVVPVVDQSTAGERAGAATSAAAQNQADELENRKQHRVAHPNYFALPAFDCDRDGDKLEYADILLRQSVMPETASQYTSCFCAHQSYMTIASDRNVRSLCHLHMLRLLRQTLGFVFGSFI